MSRDLHGSADQSAPAGAASGCNGDWRLALEVYYRLLRAGTGRSILPARIWTRPDLRALDRLLIEPLVAAARVSLVTLG